MKSIKRLVAGFLSLLLLLVFVFNVSEAEAIETAYAEPVLVDYYTNGRFEVLLMSDGQIIAQGSDEAIVDEINSWSEVSKLRCKDSYVVGIRWNGDAVCAGFNDRVTREVNEWEELYQVYIGDSYILGLCLDGTVHYSCYDKSNEAFFGLDRVRDWKYVDYIVIDGDAAVAVNVDGKIYTLGNGGYTRQKNFDPDKIKDGLIVWTSGWINFCCHDDDSFSVWGVDEYIYDIKAINKEQLSSVMPGDRGSIGVRKDSSLVWLGDMREDDPRWEFKEEINACKDVYSWSYSDSYDNGGVYVVHRDGSVQVIAEKEGNKLKAAVESWEDVTQIRAEDYFACGLNYDDSVRVFTLFKNSLIGTSVQPAADSVNSGENDWVDYVDYYRSWDFEAALRSDGKVAVVGGDEDTLKEVSGWKNVVSIDGFNNMLVGITQDGRVLSVGFSEELACQMDKWKNVSQIFWWDDFAIALREDGKMLVATDKDPFFEFDYEAVEGWKDIVCIVGDVCPMQPVLVAMDKNGKVYYLDEEMDEYRTFDKDIRDGMRISTNGYISHCVRKDGSLVSWGPESGMLDEVKLRQKEYVYALGAVGQRKDGTLSYLGKDQYVNENDPFFEAIASARDVKTLYTDGEGMYAVRNDGTVIVLKPNYYFSDAEKEALYKQASMWENVDTMEAGSGYVFVRDIAARISVFPKLSFK